MGRPGKTFSAGVAAVAAAFALAGAAAGESPRVPPRGDAAAAAGRDGDGDGDKIFDGLAARLDRAAAGERVPVIVSLTADATPERVAELERIVGDLDRVERFSLVDGIAGRATKAQVEELAQLPVVEHVEENAQLVALNESAQSSFGVTQGRVDAAVDGNADGLATYSKGDLVAAVIDTGIDPGHLDLDDGKVIAFADCLDPSPCRSSAGSGSASDGHGHGTHVAATLAGDGEATAANKGVAPGAALVGVKVLDSSGSGSNSEVIRGVEWAVANKTTYGIEVLNLSLGADGCSDGEDTLSQAVDAAVAAGLVVTVAAGNDGPDACTIGAPAAAADALTVGAMADLGEKGFFQAWFSSRGPTADGRVKPDVSAPGWEITSATAGTTSGYEDMSGTSMAAPFVAGVALLLLDVDATLTPAEVKDAIVSTAVDWGAAGTDSDYGAGRLDAYAALKAVGAAITTPPSVPAHVVSRSSLAATGAQVDCPLSVTSTTFPIAATLIVPDHGTTAADFDVRLYNPTGTLVASYDTADERQGEFGYTPTVTGTYVVRVLSESGGGAYVLDVSAGAATTPASCVAPSVSGAAQRGSSLSSETGTWLATATPTLTRQWRRCDAAGGACADIAGATGATYTLAGADVGSTLRLAVTATTSAGSATATSAATAVVTDLPAPANTAAPAISGTAQAGSTLTVAAGTWTGSPTSYAYAWRRCDGAGAACSAIVGATGATYSAAAGDVGATLRAVVTASNAAGSASATSAPTAVVAAAPAPAPTADGGGGGGGGGGSGAADLKVEGYAQPLAAAVGEAVTWYLKVTDVNFGIALGVNVDVELPSGVALESAYAERGPGCRGTAPLVCDLDWMTSDAPYANIVLVTRVTAPGELALKATVRYRSADPVPGNDSATLRANVPVAAPPAAPAPGTSSPRGASATAGADLVRGTARAETLRGLGGDDRIYGGAGADRIFGGAGDDRLDGQRGRDVLDGGGGHDTILARDRARDVVRCGPGRDRVVADRGDRVARDCERVTRR